MNERRIPMATTVYVGSARSDEYGKAHGGAARG